MCPVFPTTSRSSTAERLRQTRQDTLALIEPLAVEDMVIQSMTEASPVKWHLAHTTWFFERFVLREFLPSYTPSNDIYNYLFNSYYVAAGPRHCRPCRGMLSRPTVEQVLAYRRHVDESLEQLLDRVADNSALETRLLLGINHEWQHQELMLTDVLHMFSRNPMLPAVFPLPVGNGPPSELDETRWSRFGGEMVAIGAGPGEGFRFDNEQPRHRRFLEPYEIAHRPVTNAEYVAFIEDGGYQQHELWLSMGWDSISEQGWQCPLYWYREDGRWKQYTLAGPVDLRPDEAVCHLSYFEADAYARWSKARLPTEFEWEHAAALLPLDGVVADEGRYHPAVLDPRDTQPTRCFGDVWEWTSSSYAPYPGYAPPSGVLGEYNGKFMCNQYVLRGGSCVTPRAQARLTYRNFFPPESCWQFAGLRLARSVSDHGGPMDGKDHT
ncbi:MAG: ergothioneine biosynthesis protein EgtB [Phycisphaeraceae bacterium]|nr:ergothioneine biosynthesis protein EgtB [Phycisphaeraceae bacterium]